MEAVDEQIGLSIRSLIHNLKTSPDPLGSRQTGEYYLFDDEYDVRVTIQLLRKKSQYQLGMEMFESKDGAVK